VIANTDQGGQITSSEYLEAVRWAGVMVSMAGRGRWVGNGLMERLWRSLKCEDGGELRQGMIRPFQ
jgi:transposase InsO family protein